MIVDEFARAYPGFRQLLRTATIVRVPFAVCPYDDSDGVPGLLWTGERIPHGLEPRIKEENLPEGWTLDGSYADPPFPMMVLVSESDEPGCVAVYARPTKPGEGEAYFQGMFERDISKSAGIESLRRSRWMMKCALLCRIEGDLRALGAYFFISDRIAPFPYHNNRLVDPALHEAPIDVLRASLAQHMFERSMHVWGMKGGPSAPDRDYIASHMKHMPDDLVRVSLSECANDATHITKTVVTTMALLNARNVVLEAVDPPAQSRASRRRGEPAPYRYHVLRVKVPATRTNRALGETFTEEHVAIHWVRGHFKKYTDAKPLFGKLTGLYWWQPHLAGQGRGFVDKDYAIHTAEAAHAG